MTTYIVAHGSEKFFVNGDGIRVVQDWSSHFLFIQRSFIVRPATARELLERDKDVYVYEAHYGKDPFWMDV
jgi:hypothetical protein